MNSSENNITANSTNASSASISMHSQGGGGGGKCSQTTKRVKFTPEEDQVIKDQVDKIGRKWSEIAYLLPGRTAITVRNRYYETQRKLKKNNNSNNNNNVSNNNNNSNNNNSTYNNSNTSCSLNS